jgi:hypothetical protein
MSIRTLAAALSSCRRTPVSAQITPPVRRGCHRLGLGSGTCRSRDAFYITAHPDGKNNGSWSS